MKRSPAVSVVIPVFNRESTIERAVGSVLSQTCSDTELIIVDDGSTDGTVARVAEIEDPRVQLIVHPRNAGVSAARNTGIHAAQGAWVAFQDSDDEWAPRKLERQLNRIGVAGDRCIAAYCGMTIVGNPDRAGEASEVYYPSAALGQREGELLEALLHTSLISTQTLVAKRQSLLEVGGFDEDLPALVDWDCVLRLARLGSFAFVDEPLVRQFFSRNSITRDREKRVMAREKIVTKNMDVLKDRPAVLAGHYRAIAGEKRRLGDIPGAREAIGKACRLRPHAIPFWLILGYLAAFERSRG